MAERRSGIEERVVKSIRGWRLEVISIEEKTCRGLKTHERIDRYCIVLSSRYTGRLLDSFRFLKPVIKVPEVIIRPSLLALLKVIEVVAEVICIVPIIFIIVHCRLPPGGLYRSVDRGRP